MTPQWPWIRVATSHSPDSSGQLVSAATAAAVLFPLLSLAALGAWVYLDARARESEHPVRRAVEVALVPPLIAAYVYYRGERTGPPSDRERLALTLLLALLSAMMAGTVFSPPDVFAQPRNTFGAFLVLLPLFYLIVYRTDDERAGGGGLDGTSDEGAILEGDADGERDTD